MCIYLTAYLSAHVNLPCSKMQFFFSIHYSSLSWNFFLSIGNWYSCLCSSHQNITIYWIHIKLAFMASGVCGSKHEFLYLKYLYFSQIGYLANPSRPQRYSVFQKTEDFVTEVPLESHSCNEIWCNYYPVSWCPFILKWYCNYMHDLAANCFSGWLWALGLFDL